MQNRALLVTLIENIINRFAISAIITVQFMESTVQSEYFSFTHPVSILNLHNRSRFITLPILMNSHILVRYTGLIFYLQLFRHKLILTQTERLTMNNRPSDPKTARNKNVLVVGGSGSGKTRFFVKPSAPVRAV